METKAIVFFIQTLTIIHCQKSSKVRTAEHFTVTTGIVHTTPVCDSCLLK